MIGAISGTSAYSPVYLPSKISSVWAAKRQSNPEAAVEPVTPVRSPASVSPDRNRVFRQELPSIREGVDPAEWAVRMRIQSAQGAAAKEAVPQSAADGAKSAKNPVLSGVTGADTGAKNPVGLTDGGEAVQLPGLPGEGATLPAADTDAALGASDIQKAAEEGRCETCEKRKYQDGSDDPGVSFKTPTHVSPELAASAVRGHENEHVVREQAKAQRENRRVVSQTVTYHTEICPECGRTYISGGTTRTVTAANPSEQQNAQSEQNGGNQPYAPFSAVA